MIYKTDEEIETLIERFENCDVTEKEWTHAAHLTAALVYLLQHDLKTATDKMRSGIYKLNAAHGTPNTPERGYHETLTVFWMQTVSDYLKKTPLNKSDVTRLTNDLIKTCADSGLPLKSYSRALLFSAEARARYVEPDLEKSF
jgi:hypothetical protein